MGLPLCLVSGASGASWGCVAVAGDVGDVVTEVCVSGVGGSLSAVEHADNTENATAVGIKAVCNLIDIRVL